jgi:hypothetical protein
MALLGQDWIRSGLIKKETIYGIGVLNEPAGQYDQIWDEIIEDFYPKAYNTVRLVDPDGNFQVVIDSAFRGGDSFADYMAEQTNVVLDMHHYQGFGSFWNDMALDIPETWKNHYKHSCKVPSKKHKKKYVYNNQK